MDTTFYSDGKGNWEKVAWKPQCSHDVLMAGRCQGTEGHEGDHWAYNLHGSYCYEHQRPINNIAAGSIPPENDGYVHPADKAKDYHLNFREISVVTDPEEIARLERDEIDSNESINAPLTDEEIEELGLGGLDLG